MTVKNQADIDNPTVLTGYLVNGNMNVPLDDGNRHYQEVQVWIAEGNTPEEAYTQQELDAHTEDVVYSTMEEDVAAIVVVYNGHTYSGSRDAQNNMNTAMLKLEGKGDTKTQNWYTVDRVKQKLTRDDFDNLLDMIEPLMEDITDD